jgi:4-hydroxy-3-polyprenylbenzoate decarboxylase
MSYKNIREFIKTLESNHELVRIKARVSSYLEITEITDRVSKTKHGGKALLFENVEGSSFPVLTNAFGSERRLSLALGVNGLNQMGNMLNELLGQDVPKTITDKLRLLKRSFELSRYLPRVVKMANPPCQEVIHTGDHVDLTKLPVLHCWPHDGGPFITLPVVFTKNLISGRRNVGMYRMQVFDKNTTGMHWHIHKDGAHFFRDYEKNGKRMEVAVAIGTDPVVTYAATAPMPCGIDEMLLAGFIRREPVTFVHALTVDLEVPAEAEIILEGYVDPHEKRLEGAFGDHTGYYSLPDHYPVFHITAITHRTDALYSATVVGRPPMEDCYLATATERIFLPLLRTVFPEIRDYRLPWEGSFHNIVIVAIDKEYPGHARKVIYGLWGSGQMSLSKAVVVVDANTDLHHEAALLQKILSNIEIKRDVFITEGTLDALDHAAPRAFWGGKIGIDATSPIEGEPQRKVPLVHGIHLTADDILKNVSLLDDGFLGCRLIFPDIPMPLIIFTIKKNPEKRGNFFRDILLTQEIISRGIAVFFDNDVDIQNDSLIMWKGFNNVDPLRDISLTEKLIIIDATAKNTSDNHLRPWPDEAVMSEEVKKSVDSRLEELAIANLFKDVDEPS